jgi:hypothetical protein
MKKYLVALAIVFAVPLFAAQNVGPSLGVAQWVNPASATTFATAPNSGVTIPANTKSVAITIEGAPIRYFFNGSTAPTGTVGLKLDVGGPYLIDNKPNLATAFRFINDSSGTATVTVEYFGQP